MYSVKTTTDPDNPQEVATVDDSKTALIRELFWLMNTLTAGTEAKTESVATQADDEHGNTVTESIVTKTYQTIIIEYKTAENMAAYLLWVQRKQLTELLSEKITVCGTVFYLTSPHKKYAARKDGIAYIDYIFFVF